MYKKNIELIIIAQYKNGKKRIIIKCKFNTFNCVKPTYLKTVTDILRYITDKKISI